MIRGKHWDNGWLTAFWGREDRHAQQKDLVFGSPSRPDAHLLNSAFCHVEISHGKNLLQELTERGYDIQTLQFSIKRKTPNTPCKPLEGA